MDYNDVIMTTMTSLITSLAVVSQTFIQTQIEKKTPQLRATGLCAENSPATGEFTVQRAGSVENVSI